MVYGNHNNWKLLYKDILISNNGARILNILYIIRSVLLSKAFVITQLRRHSLTVHLRLTSVDGYKKRTTCLIGQELVVRQVRVKLGLLLTTPLAQVCPLM